MNYLNPCNFKYTACMIIDFGKQWPFVSINAVFSSMLKDRTHNSFIILKLESPIESFYDVLSRNKNMVDLYLGE